MLSAETEEILEDYMPHVCCDNPDCENFDVDLYYVDANDWNDCCLDIIAIAEEKHRMELENNQEGTNPPLRPRHTPQTTHNLGTWPASCEGVKSSIDRRLIWASVEELSLSRQQGDYNSNGIVVTLSHCAKCCGVCVPPI